MKVKDFNTWVSEKYDEAMSWRDWQTCDYLVEYRNWLEMGYNAAIEQLEKKEEIVVYPDGVKIERI